MLEWSWDRLDPIHRPDDAVAWAGLVLGFFFLLRASEFLWDCRKLSTGQQTGSPGGLRGAD
eukprot:8166208-Alexandrium_andersonii.AAC.1